MTPARLLVVAVLVALMAGLTIWQVARQRRVDACHASGGGWHGPTSTCVPPRPAPILERENLKRSGLTRDPHRRDVLASRALV